MIQILAKNVENNIFTCTQTIFNNTGHLLILEVTKKFRFNFYHSFQITTKQCIVNLASARTVHKAQCWTLSSAVIHLGYQKIEHMHHIALSEVKKCTCITSLIFVMQTLTFPVLSRKKMLKLHFWTLVCEREVRTN